MTHRKIKFASKAALDTFVKDLPATEYKAVSDKEIEVAFADMDGDEKMREMYTMMSRYMDYAMNRIYQVESMLYDHAGDGHFPKITSAEQMQRVLEKTGMDKEYKCSQKTLYASCETDKAGNLLFELKKSAKK